MLRAALLYLAFAATVLAGPGIAVQRLLLLPVDPALVLPLGIAFAAGGYWLSVVTGAPWLFPGLVLVLDLSLLRGPWRRAFGPSPPGAVAPFAPIGPLFPATPDPLNPPPPTRG